MLHVAETLRLLGDSAAEAEAGAAAVMRLESAMAATHMTRTERRDPETCYNKCTMAKLGAICKGAVEWARYFELAGKPEPGAYLNVDSPPALAAASRLIATSDGAELQSYLRWHVAHAYAAHLPKAHVDAHFEFYAKFLSGQKEQKPRWKRAMGWVESALGEAVGELYVARFFAGGAKAAALTTVEAVRVELQRRLEEVKWMSGDTRQKALEKMVRARTHRATTVSPPCSALPRSTPPPRSAASTSRSATPTRGSTTARSRCAPAITWATSSARAPSSTAVRWASPTRRRTSRAGSCCRSRSTRTTTPT